MGETTREPLDVEHDENEDTGPGEPPLGHAEVEVEDYVLRLELYDGIDEIVIEDTKRHELVRIVDADEFFAAVDRLRAFAKNPNPPPPPKAFPSLEEIVGELAGAQR